MDIRKRVYLLYALGITMGVIPWGRVNPTMVIIQFMGFGICLAAPFILTYWQKKKRNESRTN